MLMHPMSKLEDLMGLHLGKGALEQSFQMVHHVAEAVHSIDDMAQETLEQRV